MTQPEFSSSQNNADLLSIAAEFDDGCRIIENSIDRANEEWRLHFSNGYCLCLRSTGSFEVRRR